MRPTGLTVEILEEIRDQANLISSHIEWTHSRLDAANVRLAATNTRLDTVREELSRQIVASEARTTSAIADLSFTIGELTGFLRTE